MNIGKFLQRRNIFVLIDLTINPPQQLPIQLQDQLIIIKNLWSNTPKPKMSNSFELLQGSIADIQKNYEGLSDIVTEHNGKVHGSQRDIDPKTGLIDLLV
jgi:hypothetical protein